MNPTCTKCGRATIMLNARSCGWCGAPFPQDPSTLEDEAFERAMGSLALLDTEGKKRVLDKLKLVLGG